MTNEQFAAYLLDESHLYTIGYEELKTLVMNYPYSANLRVLLLKKSLLEKNKDVERNTSMAATYVTDRRQLYKSVKKLKNPIKVSENVLLGADYLELTQLSSLDKILAEKTIPTDFTDTTGNDKTLSIDLTSSRQSELPKNLSLDLSLPATLPEKIVEADAVEAQPIISNIEKESVQEEMQVQTALLENKLEPAIEPVVSETVSTEKEPEKQSAENLEQYRSITLIEDGDIDSLYASLKEENKSDIETIQSIKPVNATEMPIEFEINNTTKNIITEAEVKADESPKISFTNWLQQFRVSEPQATATSPVENTSAIIETPIASPISSGVDMVANENENSEPILKLKETIKPRPIKKVKFDSLAQLFESTDNVPENLFESTEKKNSETTDARFLSEEEEDKPLNGRSSKNKTEMHDLAIKSLASHDDILSETLADIHLKQGNFAKAVEMYERLMLQNPEKSDYFAAKIKKFTVSNEQ